MADGNEPKRLVFTDKERFHSFTCEGANWGQEIQAAVEPIVERMVAEGYDPSDIYSVALREAEFVITMTIFGKRWEKENDNG